jgi:hypothetical protein
MFPLPYSARTKAKPDTLKYDLPEIVRSRILHNLQAINESRYGGITKMLEDAGQRCFLQYGGLRKNNSGVVIYNPELFSEARDHFFACTDDEAIDFIEWCFQSDGYRGQQNGVETVNNILREEGIGYEFSPYVVTTIQLPSNGGNASSRYDIQFPEATKKSNELLHSTTVMPCLHLLSNPKFKVANAEMLQAHAQFRKGEFEAAINACGQSFESVFKTICTAKKWKYDADKDTLSKLIEICAGNGLFPSFYTEIFKASGIIRNKFGSHGKGPTPPHGVAGAEHAEHLVQQTSAHILLLARLAKM